MAGVFGQRPPCGGCDRCQHDPVLRVDWALSAVQLCLSLSETGGSDATTVVVASLLAIRLVVELLRVLYQSDR